MIRAVQNGEADAMLQSDVSINNDFRIIGRFSPDPYYFALSPNNTQLLQQLNIAMRSLGSSQPNLQTELYDLHFRYMGEFQLSDEYRECIDSLGTVKVLFFDGDAPFQYIKDGELTGFSVEYFKKFAETTGLQYEVVMANTYAEAFSMIENGEVDLVACVATNSTLASLDNVKFTIPYFNSFSVTVCSNQQPHKHEDNLESRMNTELALSQIQDKENEAVRADYYALSYYLRKDGIYENVVVDWANTQNFSYTVGVTDKIPNEFIALLNQYASSVSNDTKQAMLYKYSADPMQYTLSEWLFIHRTVLLLSLVIGCAMLVVLALHLRSKHLERKALAAENKLVHLSMYDAMTGAYNEVQFRKLLQECCNNKENVALVAFNIRGFKYINDTYGNKRADDLLCEIKTLLESEIQKGEFFCRPNADLFYLALKEPDEKHLLSRMNSIFSKIAAVTAISLDGHPLSLYSGAVFVGDSPTPYHVSPNMSYVMTAIAHAKMVNLQGTYIFDKPLYQTEQLHYYIETHMKAALEKGEYKLYLQPKMNLQTGCIDGADALVRWQPSDRDMIYPDQFIPFFEEKGFCAHLDLYMIEQVCKTLRTWIDAGIVPIVISVNQTKALFVKEDYVESLLAITEKYHISPEYIILEILEGLAFENIESLNRTIQKLNRAGFRVSMDDFGSGYSSLNTLGKVEINELKLDREFLMNVVNDPTGSQSVVLASILSLARKLGINTVAEGVETKENEDMIRSMCCDYGQGYYYSKPIPAETFREKFCTLESNIFDK